MHAPILPVGEELGKAFLRGQFADIYKNKI